MDEIRKNLRTHFPELSAIAGEALQQFASALRKRQALLFIGAGVSIESGLPSGASLVRELQLATGSESDDLRTLCSVYEKQHSTYALRKKLLDLLDDWNKPLSPVHQLLPLLNLSHVVTTNIDRLTEEAYRQLRVPFRVFSLPQDLVYASVEELTVLKIHGTLEHPHTLVFSDNDYQFLLDKDHAFIQELQNLFARFEIMTLGFSADEPDFNPVVQWMSAKHEGKQVLALHIDQQAADLCQSEAVLPVVLNVPEGTSPGGRIAGLLGILAGLPDEQVPVVPRVVNRRRNPFRRLEAYRVEDKQRFYEREYDLAKIVQSLRDYQMLLLFGESGVGKTSFLQAGLMPHYMVEYGSASVTLATVSGDLFTQWPTLIQKIDRQRGLLILDQFERFFDAALPESEVRHFLVDELSNTRRQHPNLQCLFVIRRDRMPELHRYKQFHPGLYHESQELLPLSDSSARRILQRYFAQAKYPLDDSLLQETLAACVEGDRVFLPALQLLGHGLFEQAEQLRLNGQLQDGAGLSLQQASYQEDILRAYVNEALQAFSGREQYTVLLQVLRQLVRYSKRQTLKQNQLAELFPDPLAARAILNLLVDQRLVRFVTEQDAYELIHDSLIDPIETGPLAVEVHYTQQELFQLYWNQQKQQRLSISQLQGILKFCLGQGLPHALWVNALLDKAVDVLPVLKMLARDNNHAVATAALQVLYGFALTDDDLSFHRYLRKIVLAALFDHEPQDKGRAACLLLLTLGLTKEDTVELLDFIDPNFTKTEGETLEGYYPFSEFDRDLAQQLLPPIMAQLDDKQITQLIYSPFYAEENNLGHDIVALHHYELARRGLFSALLQRYPDFIEEDAVEYSPEAAISSLVNLPETALARAEFSEVRRQLIASMYGLYLDPRPEVASKIGILMQQEARFQPEPVFLMWLRGFDRWQQDEAVWPSWRAAAEQLIQHPKCFSYLLYRLSATYAVAEQKSLCEILLFLTPDEKYTTQVLGASNAFEAQLLNGLDAAFVRKFGFDQQQLPPIELPALRHDLAELSALGLWRNADWLAEQTDIPRHIRWERLLQLAAHALNHAALVSGHHELAMSLSDYSDPQAVDQQYNTLWAYHQDYLDDVVEAARRALLSAVQAFNAFLLDVPDNSANIEFERTVHWLNVVLTHTPDLHCDNDYWPPLGCPYEQFPALKRFFDSLASLPTEVPGVQDHLEVLYQCRDQWVAAKAGDIAYYLALQQWMTQRAAMLAVYDNAHAYLDWFQALNDIHEDRTLDLPSWEYSRFEWAFRQSWESAPRWLLYYDPRACHDDYVDSDELVWLLEVACRFDDPAALCPVLVDWLAEVVAHAALSLTGFNDNEVIGKHLLQLCQSAWAGRLTLAHTEAMLEHLMDADETPYEAFEQAALHLWAESDYETLLEAAIKRVLEGRGEIKESAVAALNRWYERHT